MNANLAPKDLLRIRAYLRREKRRHQTGGKVHVSTIISLALNLEARCMELTKNKKARKEVEAY